MADSASVNPPPPGDVAGAALGPSDAGPRTQPSLGQLEADLAKSQARFRTLMEHVSEGVFITDHTGKFIDANPCVLDLLGLTREELLARRITDTVTAAERARVASAVTKVLGGQLQMSEWAFARTDGVIFRGEVCARLMPDGCLLGILRDVSKNRETEQALRESEARLRALADNSPIGVFMASPDGQNIYSNTVLQKQLGRTYGEMLGEIWARSASLHADDCAPMAAAWQDFIMRRAPFDQVARFVRPDGAVRLIHSRVTEVRTGGRVGLLRG
jgi:PAS domain S-box-containing protein